MTDREPCRFIYSAGVIGNSLSGLEPFGFLRDFRIYGSCLSKNVINSIFYRKEEESDIIIKKLITWDMF